MNEIHERDELGFVTEKGASYHSQEVLNALADILVEDCAAIEAAGGTFSADALLFRAAKRLRDNRREMMAQPKFYCRVCGGGVSNPGGVHDLCDR